MPGVAEPADRGDDIEAELVLREGKPLLARVGGRSLVWDIPMLRQLRTWSLSQQPSFQQTTSDVRPVSCFNFGRGEIF